MLIWNVSPVAFSFLGLKIYWYGIIYASSLILSWMTATWVLRKIRNLGELSVPSAENFDKFMFWAIIWTVIGARVGHIVFFDFQYYIQHPLEIFMLRKGGLSFHGSVLAISLYTLFYCHIQKLPWRIMIDILSIAGALGIGVGRLANFFNQELYGKLCKEDFAIIFSAVDQIPRYPTQLLESCFEGFLNFWILITIFRFNGAKIIGSGCITFIFCLIYSSSRFVIEFYKEISEGNYYTYLSMTTGQILSIALFLLSFFVINYKRVRAKNC
jgi:phosphatidylglycerol:prolipoprotein diacylglycerol transferase